ncbi:hypothetical protein E5163_00250 [Marinicauda algicola]|uniref:Lipoprotein n=2 Tax=Marinicauda algicola TaxID=2029849 RepID=A0A4S2H2B5_9PROT|nr:hypothetical protein E5163_00250 [Marinicauda algicola]
MNIVRLTCGVLALGLAACATPTDTSDRDAAELAEMRAAEEAGLVCEYERIMGSLRRERVCRTQDEIDRAREEAFRETDRAQRATPGPQGGS